MLALRAALLFNCVIQNSFTFDRKHYSYQDLPHAYQITQYNQPYAIKGAVNVKKLANTFPLDRIQIEMDSGKVVHLGEGEDLVDLNRAGIGLLEIVTGPIFRSPSGQPSQAAQEAVLFGKTLQSLLKQAEVCHGNLEEGQLRFDVNVSVTGPNAPKEAGPLGTRVEIKNLNSFAALSAAIDSEAARQICLIKQGKLVSPNETRSFDIAKRQTVLMRGKESSKDYKFIRDFDISEVMVTPEMIEAVKMGMPKTLDQIETEMAQKYGLRSEQIEILLSNPCLNFLFIEICSYCKASPNTIYNWLATELVGQLNRQNMSLEQCMISPLNHAKLLDLIEEGRIDRNSAKTVLTSMISNQSENPFDVATKLNLILPVESNDLLDSIRIEVDKILADDHTKAEEAKTGKRSLDYFIGPLMRQFKGQIKPIRLRQILQEQLDKL